MSKNLTTVWIDRTEVSAIGTTHTYASRQTEETLRANIARMQAALDKIEAEKAEKRRNVPTEPGWYGYMYLAGERVPTLVTEDMRVTNCYAHRQPIENFGGCWSDRIPEPVFKD